MSLVSAEASPTPPPIPAETHRRPRLLRPGWPLSVLFLAFPLWWGLGLTEFIFFFAAVPMALALILKQRVTTPRGFGLWLCFLATVVISGLVLTAIAPYGVNGGLGGRVMTFNYRLLWYASATIALLYVGNMSEKDLPAERVSRLLAAMFVVTSLGGLLGVVLPHLQFSSALELLLPSGVTQNRFLSALIHPATADIENVLGFDQPRPRAPFAYSNSWGANFSFFLPFFLHSWCRRTSGWRRLLAPFVLVSGGIAVIYSLNRGLWLALIVAAVYGVVHLLRTNRLTTLRWMLPVILVVVLVVAASPLPSIVSQRLANPHSNDRRSELALTSVKSALIGSPVIGFGNTRDVQGAFSSIAGGTSAACPSCGVPPLGTQGQVWLVVFSQGLVGTFLFLAFFLVRFARHAASRRTVTVLGMTVLLCFLVELLVYDTLGSPLFTVMLALGLMWRADRCGPDPRGALS